MKRRPSARAAVASLALFAFVGLIAYANFLPSPHFGDVYLPVMGVGFLVASPVVALLVIAARQRGEPWPWLAFAVAWGLFAAPWLALLFEGLLTGTGERVLTGVPALIASLPDWLRAPSTIVAPGVEEPAKLIGTIAVVLAARRTGARLTVGLGAAVGGLVGLAFGLSEIGHFMARFVLDNGYENLSGVFVIDRGSIQRLAVVQLASRLILLGASNHALFSAAGGVAVIVWLGGRHRSAIGWFAGALITHALFNVVGGTIGKTVINGLLDQVGTAWLGLALAGWLAGAATFLIAESWLATLLVRRLRRGGPQAVREQLTVAPADGVGGA